MDRGLSRSMPYLPRYHSASPARSPRLDSRRFLSPRSVSTPKQRIIYVNSEPMRVLNSYPLHHSPSPHRPRVCHLLTSKPNQHLVRKSRSLSEHDLLSTHVYASQEDLGVKSYKESPRRLAESCEDIYHKGPYYPDKTASESGVSVGCSEEGSMFDAEDDTMSQHSFGSSSAFFEVTVDSELDRLDSDATHSGAEGGLFGDRTLNVLYEDDIDERGCRGTTRGQGRNVHSPDSNRSSPLAYGDSRKRELMSSPSLDLERLQSRFQALRVTIPGNESTSVSKSPRDDRKRFGDKGGMPSTPLAQSTPHVSPRGFGESKLSVMAVWNVDDPEGDGVFLEKGAVEKSRASRALFQMDVSDCESRLSSRAADSSLNSSLSEDNFSDVSSLTVSSFASAPRKTKRVKKPSDLPASARAINALHDDTGHTSSGESVMRVDTGPELVPPRSDTQNVGNEWWAVYNIGSAQAREADSNNGEATEGEEDLDRNTLSSYKRDIRVVKPVKVSIPLISAGKQGQEKLKRLSQTSPTSSLPNSPRLSPRRESPLSPSEGAQGNVISCPGNTNMGYSPVMWEDEEGAVMKFDQSQSPISKKGDAGQEGDREKGCFRYPERSLSSAFSPGDDEEDNSTHAVDNQGRVSPGKEATLAGMFGKPRIEDGGWGINSYNNEPNSYSGYSGELVGQRSIQGAQPQIDVDNDSKGMPNSAPCQCAHPTNAARCRVYCDHTDDDRAGQDELSPEIAMHGESAVVDRATEVKGLVNGDGDRQPPSEQHGNLPVAGGDGEAGRSVGEIDSSAGHWPHYELGNASLGEAGEGGGGGRGCISSTGLPVEGTQVSAGPGVVRAENIPEVPVGGNSQLGRRTPGERTSAASEREALNTEGRDGVGGFHVISAEFQNSVSLPTAASEEVNKGCVGETLSEGIFTQHSETRGSPLDYEKARVSRSEQKDTQEEVNTARVNNGRESAALLGQVALSGPGQGQVSIDSTSPLFSSQNVTASNDRDFEHLQQGQGHRKQQQLGACPGDREVDPGGRDGSEEEKEMMRIERNRIDGDAAPVSLTTTAASARGTTECGGETPLPMTVRVVATAQNMNDSGGLTPRRGDDISCASAFTSPRREEPAFPHSHRSITAAPGCEFTTTSSVSDDSRNFSVDGKRFNQLDNSFDQSRVSGNSVDRVSYNNNNGTSVSGLGAAFDSEGNRCFRLGEETLRSGGVDQVGSRHVKQSIEQSGVACGLNKETSPQGIWREYPHSSENSEQFYEKVDDQASNTLVKPPQVTEVSSKRVKHVHRTTIEKIVTTERIVNQSPPNSGGLSSGDSSSGPVDIVTDKSTTETIIKEADDYFTTTTSAVYPDSSFQHTTVSNTHNAFSGNSINNNNGNGPGLAWVTSPPCEATPAPTQQQGPVSRGDIPCPASHSSRVAAHADVISHHVTGGEKGAANWENNTFRVTEDTASSQSLVAAGEAPVTGQALHNNNTSAEMTASFPVHRVDSGGRPVIRHSDSLLDSLEAELSRLSSDLSTLRSEVVGDEVRAESTQHSNTRSVYRDHAEATSVLKHIVRGDDLNVSSLSNVSGTVVVNSYKTNSFPLDIGEEEETFITGEEWIPSVATGVEENGGLARSEREYYDNDYDLVTTQLPKTSQRHHNLQRLKPGQLKASSLWTLQEETESLIDANSPKSSPVRTLATLASEDENSSDKASEASPVEERRGVRGLTENDEWSADENANIKLPRSLSAGLEEKRQFVCESSDFEESDGNYSSISTSESNSRWSSSFGREQTPLSEPDVSPPGPQDERMDYQEVEEVSPGSAHGRISSFQDFVTGLHSANVASTVSANSPNNFSFGRQHAGHQMRSPMGNDVHDMSGSANFTSSSAFSVSGLDNSMSVLDSLSASLEQFATPEFWGNSEASRESNWHSDVHQRVSSSSSSMSHTLNSSDFREDVLNASASSSAPSWHEETPSRLHTLDLDLSRISSCPSPVPSDLSESSQYTCTGTAQIRRVAGPASLGDYDIPAPTSTPKGKPPKVGEKRPLPAEIEVRRRYEEENVKRFDRLLTEFDKQCRPEGLNDLVFLEEKRREGTDVSGAGDMYKAFTVEDTEKKQNHSCIVVEDENMGTFRFKRFLKKSHTKRNKKGRKVLRFLSRLGCVSESVHSPDMSANRKQYGGDVYSTDSMPSPKHRKVSSPILLSSTSFHHFQEFSPCASPQASPAKSTPSSSNQSLDSLRSRTDSAYSSVSESLLGSVSSPVALRQHRLSSSVFSTGSSGQPRVLTPSSGSVSAVFHSEMTHSDVTHVADSSLSDSAYSTDMTTNPRSFNEADLSVTDTTVIGSSSVSAGGPSDKGMDTDMLSALSDVFDQLDVCEGEIDNALLNRIRYGHREVNEQHQ
ncbi:uncharacterized protein LOC101858372 [Aplysia californica]|uniref:Uncharacterized protein LOC101858372 n=1 Tax=Aplysia californica TaxID=6500 RepID=A0ABM0K8M2_APLCA|nr:uncharacterized protein LOC101858372 [Aplysia californica]